MDKTLGGFNPKLKELIAKKDITVIGVWWAFVWRLWVLWLVGVVALGIILLTLVISSKH